MQQFINILQEHFYTVIKAFTLQQRQHDKIYAQRYQHVQAAAFGHSDSSINTQQW